MRRWSAGELAGIVVPMLAVLALLAGIGSEQLRWIESPLAVAAIGLGLAAAAGVFFRLIGLACATVALGLVAYFSVHRSPEIILALTIPPMAAAIGASAVTIARVRQGWQQARAIRTGGELNRLRERVADLEAASRAGSPVQVLGAASSQWMDLANEAAESGAALLARLPDALLDRAEAKRFIKAVRGLRRGLVAQAAIGGAVSHQPQKESRLATAVEKGVAAAAEVCHAHGINVETDLSQSGPPCVLDEDLLAIAVAAVVANAAEASPRGTTVSILAHADWRGERGLIEITDRGSGIAPDNMAMIFKPFYTTRPGRLGLGLAMAKELLARMGGSIAVSANETRGMTFRIRIPMRRPEAVGEGPERLRDASTAEASTPATPASVERAAKSVGTGTERPATTAEAEAEIALLTKTIEMAKAAAEARREANSKRLETEEA